MHFVAHMTTISGYNSSTSPGHRVNQAVDGLSWRLLSRLWTSSQNVQKGLNRDLKRPSYDSCDSCVLKKVSYLSSRMCTIIVMLVVLSSKILQNKGVKQLVNVMGSCLNSSVGTDNSWSKQKSGRRIHAIFLSYHNLIQ